jgi:glucokinase
MARSAIQAWLLADVGGTHTRLARLVPGGTPSDIRILDNDRYPGLRALIASSLATCPGDRARLAAAIAVAAPVVADTVQMTNRAWDFSIEALRCELGLVDLWVINDFTAVAWSLPALAAADSVPIGGGAARPDAPIGVMGPGTGLGVSGLIPCDRGYTALAGEGGHVTLAASCPEEEAVLAMVRGRYGHASAERLVSGPGLVTLYACLRAQARLEAIDLSPEEISALAGTEPHAGGALAMWFAFLGSVAGDLALTLGALGGIYLAGGILPQLAGALAASAFRERFVAKGRYRGYLEAIPTRLITRPHPALLGLRARIAADARLAQGL